MRLLVILLVVATASALPGRRLRPLSGKIVGGEATDITEVPWQLSLQAHQIFWSHICGASIVSENVVVTAAHCVSGSQPKNVRFLSGSSTTGDGAIHNAQKINVHPSYTDLDYDVAVVTVEEPFEWSETTQPIAIATKEPMEGEECIVSGWGALKEGGLVLPKQLQSVKLPIVSRETCQDQYADVTDGMICAGVPEGGKDSCQGDSGGPLVVNNTLAGIVSWGEGCARPDRSGVYTNVAAFSDWINERINAAKLH